MNLNQQFEISTFVLSVYAFSPNISQSSQNVKSFNAPFDIKDLIYHLVYHIVKNFLLKEKPCLSASIFGKRKKPDSKPDEYY